MDNPYIVAIHTFPPVVLADFLNANESDLRKAYIIIEYGPMPMPAPSPSTSTAEQGSVGQG